MATLSDMLDTLTATAVLGTARQVDVALSWEGEIGALCATLPAADAETKLLNSAAVLATAALAGVRPVMSAPSDTPPAACEPVPTTGLQSAAQLRRVLASGNWPLLEDWCRTTLQRGCCAPEEVLPALLAVLRTHLHEAAVAPGLVVIGPRGRWLARRNPAWVPLVADFDELSAIWEVATGVERARLLAVLRRLDAARARDALALTLPSEHAEMRAALITALGVGLLPEDEPFLEAALDDASKIVRRAAADLLSALPEARLGVRMAERVRRLIKVEQVGGILRKKRKALTVVLPESSKDLLRDGVESKRLDEMGAKAWMLAQIVAATPLAAWNTIAALDSREWLAASDGDEWRGPLMLGWIIAAGRQADAAWAAALLAGLVGGAPDVPPGALHQWLSPLVAAVAPEERETILHGALARKSGGLTATPAWDVLLACTHAWSPDFSRVVLTAVTAHLTALGSNWDPRLRPEHAATLAACADLATAVDLTARMTAGEYTAATQRWVDELVGLVQLRREYS